jgi:hypothetical protein
MRRRPRFALAQWLLLSTLALTLAVTATFYVFLASSRRAILERSDELREATARRMDRALDAELDVGATVLDETAMAMRFGALRAEDSDAVEASLFSVLLDHPTLSDMTWTHATRVGYEAGGDALLAPLGRWQITVYRASADPGSAILTLRTKQVDGRREATRTPPSTRHSRPPLLVRWRAERSGATCPTPSSTAGSPRAGDGWSSRCSRPSTTPPGGSPACSVPGF